MQLYDRCTFDGVSFPFFSFKLCLAIPSAFVIVEFEEKERGSFSFLFLVLLKNLYLFVCIGWILVFLSLLFSFFVLCLINWKSALFNEIFERIVEVKVAALCWYHFPASCAFFPKFIICL